MKTGIEMARRYLQCCGYSLVVVRECVEIVSHEQGIMPLLMIYDKCPDKLDGAFLADKVIGKAAAFILAETGVKAVYGAVMSEPGAAVLEKKGIGYGYGKLVPEIMNREGNELCPMEKACRELDDPLDGIMAITAILFRDRCSPKETGTGIDVGCRGASS